MHDVHEFSRHPGIKGRGNGKSTEPGGLIVQTGKGNRTLRVLTIIPNRAARQSFLSEAERLSIECKTVAYVGRDGYEAPTTYDCLGSLKALEQLAKHPSVVAVNYAISAVVHRRSKGSGETTGAGCKRAQREKVLSRAERQAIKVREAIKADAPADRMRHPTDGLPVPLPPKGFDEEWIDVSTGDYVRRAEWREHRKAVADSEARKDRDSLILFHKEQAAFLLARDQEIRLMGRRLLSRFRIALSKQHA